jgi:hypothetical protein
MDFALAKFGYTVMFDNNQRIINLFNIHNIEYEMTNNKVSCKIKSLISNIFMNDNVEVFVELSNIIEETDYRYFRGKIGYYHFFTNVILCFGNKQMIDFLQSRIDLCSVPTNDLKYLGYRLDDNVEIVHVVLDQFKNNQYVPHTKMLAKAISSDNINIFKYVYNSVINTDPLIEHCLMTKYNLIWTKSNIQFLEFFLSKSLLSEKDIIRGALIVTNNEKIELVLSYVDSGHLKLSDETVKLLNEFIDKN